MILPRRAALSLATSSAVHVGGLCALGIALAVGFSPDAEPSWAAAEVHLHGTPEPRIPRNPPEPPAPVEEHSPTEEPELVPLPLPEPPSPFDVPPPDWIEPEPYLEPHARLLTPLPEPQPEEQVLPPEAAELPAPRPQPAGPPDSGPVLLDNPPPAYPRAAQRLGQEGSVRLRIEVDANGAVSDVQLLESSGHELLDEAAIQGVKGWSFEPAVRSGQRVPDSFEHRVTFTLSGRG